MVNTMYQGTTIGDTLYWDGTSWIIVPAHVAATLALLRQTGTGSAGGVPTWDITHGSAQHDATLSKIREIPTHLNRYNSTTSTTYADDYMHIPFDKSQYDRIASIRFVCWLTNEGAGTYQVWAQLYNWSDGGAVAGSEVTGTYAQYGGAILVSGDIQANIPNSAKAFGLQQKAASGGTCIVQGAMLVVRQLE
jgi:hypothetical protein